MKKEIKIPAMGESVSEAVIGAILKKTGTFVRQDEEIIELETDKVNQVLYAPADGVVSFTVSTQQTVKIGEVIGFVDTEAKAAAAPAARRPAAERLHGAPFRSEGTQRVRP